MFLQLYNKGLLSNNNKNCTVKIWILITSFLEYYSIMKFPLKLPTTSEVTRPKLKRVKYASTDYYLQVKLFSVFWKVQKFWEKNKTDFVRNFRNFESKEFVTKVTNLAWTWLWEPDKRNLINWIESTLMTNSQKEIVLLNIFWRCLFISLAIL